jgi:hypothetical protein
MWPSESPHLNSTFAQGYPDNMIHGEHWDAIDVAAKDLVTARSDLWRSKAAARYVGAQARLWRAVQLARTDGVTWEIIAHALNVTRQSAQERFSKPAPSFPR